MRHLFCLVGYRKEVIEHVNIGLTAVCLQHLIKRGRVQKRVIARKHHQPYEDGGDLGYISSDPVLTRRWLFNIQSCMQVLIDYDLRMEVSFVGQ